MRKKSRKKKVKTFEERKLLMPKDITPPKLRWIFGWPHFLVGVTK